MRKILAPSFQKISLYSLRIEIEYSQSSRQRQLRSQKFRSVETSGRGLLRRAQTQWRFIDPRALRTKSRPMNQFNMRSKDSRHTSAVTTERQGIKNSSLSLRSRPNRLLIVC